MSKNKRKDKAIVTEKVALSADVLNNLMLKKLFIVPNRTTYNIILNQLTFYIQSYIVFGLTNINEWVYSSMQPPHNQQHIANFAGADSYKQRNKYLRRKTR